MSVEKRTRTYPNGKTKTSNEVRWRDADNKQRSPSFDSRADADAYDHEVNHRRQLGTLPDVALGGTTVGAFAEQWLGWQVHLKPKTLAGYRSLLDTQVLPHWRTVRLDRITYASVCDWVSALCHKPGRGGELLSPSRVRQAYHMLTGMLDGAVAAHYLPANPARGVALPVLEDRRHRRALTHDQVSELAEACGPHRLMVLLMAYTGMRWGEVVGLPVGDVHVDRQVRHPQLDLGGRITIHVNQAVADLNGTLVVSTLKSHQRRWVDVPAVLEAELLARVDGRPDDALVFRSRSGGPLRVGNFRRDWFDKAAAAIGLPGLTPHELRHTAATLAIESGASVKDIQQMLGHKDATLTLNRYGHHTGTGQARMAESISRAAEQAQERRRK
jgi:integrase